jgi:hypothetical protein
MLQWIDRAKMPPCVPGMSEIGFLTYLVLLKRMEQDFQIMLVPFNLIQFQKNDTVLSQND